MELAFGKVVDVNGGNGEWLGKAYDIPHTPTPGSTSRDITTPREDTDRSGGGTTPTTPTPSIKSSQDRSPLGCLHAASGNLPRLPEDSSQSIKTPVVTPKPKIHDDIPTSEIPNIRDMTKINGVIAKNQYLHLNIDSCLGSMKNMAFWGQNPMVIIYLGLGLYISNNK
ncbi:unnamed protein product [Rotaria magnacalcarata]|uniref:Uncharacterized protein n=1 Tax=Rotaria magnacalcarata TaxID=392030 RepID=A0A819GFT7_9BILA|nr:unnamed protein product [Rotaria magnacalcarata]